MTSTKHIYSYEIGQLIFTAHSREILPTANSLNIPYGLSQIDRPIAGYLYGKVTRTSFLGDARMVRLGVSIGTVGDNSFGRQTQELWHSMIGVKQYWNWVWDYQVKNELGVNLHGTIAQSLVKAGTASHFQVTPVTEATLGTTFTNISQAVLLQFGSLRPISSSSYWNSRLQRGDVVKGRKSMELFVYYRPEVKYQIYNATIQGGLFSNDKGPILSTPEPFVFSHEFGIRFSVSRYCLGYHVTFQSKEAQGQFNRQSYASFFLAYRF